jgi:hypothetical protein
MANAHRKSVKAIAARVSAGKLSVDLSDGRSITVPLTWYPRLLLGKPAERKKWRLAGAGQGIHWPDLDEDISIEGMLLGYASGESKNSLSRWLERRRRKGESKGK